MIGIYHRLRSFFHEFDGEFLLGHFAFACDNDNRDGALVSIFHLFLDLGGLRIDFCVDAVFANLIEVFQAVFFLVHAEVEEDDLGAFRHGLREEIEAFQHVVDAVGTEADTHAGDVGQAEDASKVIVTTATRDASDGEVLGFYLKDSASVLVKTTSQSQVEFGVDTKFHVLDVVEQGLEFLDTFLTDFIIQQRLQLG